MKPVLETVPVFTPFSYLESLRDISRHSVPLVEYEDHLMKILNNMGLSDDQITRFVYFNPEED